MDQSQNPMALRVSSFILSTPYLVSHSSMCESGVVVVVFNVGTSLANVAILWWDCSKRRNGGSEGKKNEGRKVGWSFMF